MKRIALCCLLAVSACTTPDVTSDIKAASDLLETSNAAFRPTLEKQAKAEVLEAERLLIATGADVYELKDCRKSDDFAIMPNCRLTTTVDLSGGTASASTSLEALDAINGYFESLLAIASSESSDAVKQQATALVAALDEAAKDKYAPLARLTAKAGKNAPKAAAVAGFLANQYRVAQLRKIVRKADPEIESILLSAAAYLDQQSKLSEFHAALVTAETEMELAQISGDPKRYRKKLNKLSASHAAFINAQTASAGNSFRLLRALHGDLLQRLNAPAAPSEILTTVTEIRTVVDTLRKKED